MKRYTRRAFYEAWEILRALAIPPLAVVAWWLLNELTGWVEAISFFAAIATLFAFLFALSTVWEPKSWVTVATFLASFTCLGAEIWLVSAHLDVAAFFLGAVVAAAGWLALLAVAALVIWLIRKLMNRRKR